MRRTRSGVTAHKLKQRKGERDLAFAWRVLAAIHADFDYAYPPKHKNRLPAEVCGDGASDCGGLSLLFTTVCRQNRIPARVLVGRWANPDKEGDPQYHVRAEFHAKGVGWVPVDGSGAVTWNGAPASAFGVHRANFIIMHEGTDLHVAALPPRQRELAFMQMSLCVTRSSGPLVPDQVATEWKVQVLKTDGGSR